MKPNLSLSGETEAGAAEEQPARDSRYRRKWPGGITRPTGSNNIFFAMPKKA
ncbi:MAG: hypothetical protein ACE5IR_22790 [bacterium]